MKKIILLLTVIPLFLCGCATGNFEIINGTETDVFIPSGSSYCAATLRVPEKINPAMPAVIFLPGFLGERDELPVEGTVNVPAGGRRMGIFELAAAEYAAAGAVSLRIDYRNFGRSPGRTEDALLTRQLEDVISASAWLRSVFPESRLALCGFSLGGALAASAAEEAGTDYLLLWSSPDRLTDMIGFVPPELHPVMEAEGVADFLTPWGEEVRFRKDYFDSSTGFDVMAAVNSFDKPVFLAAASYDPMVAQPAAAFSYMDAHPGAHELLVVGSDHSFNNYRAKWDVLTVIRQSLSWLRKQAEVPGSIVGGRIAGTWRLKEFIQGGGPLGETVEFYMDFSADRVLQSFYRLPDGQLYTDGIRSGYSYLGSDRLRISNGSSEPESRISYYFEDGQLLLNFQTVTADDCIYGETMLLERASGLNTAEALQGPHVSEVIRQ